MRLCGNIIIDKKTEKGIMAGLNVKHNIDWGSTYIEDIIHPKIIKPWGHYVDRYRSKNCVFKIITVNPHCKLSLQSHKKRIEIWHVLKGSGQIELGMSVLDTEIEELFKYDTINIEDGEIHRLINNTNEILVVAEMQYGICDEDDIIRYDDDYGRPINEIPTK
jgi:mannose-6-phosphate isomerase-like protein (cupin superfamily)